MSGSSKKKLRKESNAAAMTEKQQKQAKDAKKLQVYTRTFIIVMAVIVALMVGIVVRQPVSDALYRNAHALTIGDHEITAIELNYFYTDAILKHYKQYSDKYGDYAMTYAMLMEGIDFTKPMDEQVRDATTQQTWAEAFLTSAIQTAKETYAIYDKAMSDKDFKNDVQETTYLANIESYLDMYAYYAGFSSVESYLRDSYGDGANLETYKAYCIVTETASAYKAEMRDGIEYLDEQYRAFEKGKETDYSRFSFATFVIHVDTYLEGGTTSTDENGKTVTTYSEEEKKAALEAAKADVQVLLDNEILNGVKSFDLAIGRLDKYKDNKTAKATEKSNVFGSTITDKDLMAWLTSEDRTANEMGSIEIFTTSKDADGKEVKTVTGYTVVLFLNRDDGLQKLQNVRHILFKIDGMEDFETGEIISDEEDRQVAKKAAERVLGLWEATEEKTGEAFGELAKTHSEDGSASSGGIIADIFPGQTAKEFNDWCFDEKRQKGDVELIETEFGFHIMYYIGESDITYRDSLLKEEMLDKDIAEWTAAMANKISLIKHNLDYVNMGYSLG